VERHILILSLLVILVILVTVVANLKFRDNKSESARIPAIFEIL
jgi:hypothetical protein